MTQCRLLPGFDLGLDSKLRSCELARLRVRDICHGDRTAARATVLQRKTSRPVQFEITEQSRIAIAAWIKLRNLHAEAHLIPSRVHESPHLGTRRYARIVESWVTHVGLDSCAYGTHSMRCHACRTNPRDWASSGPPGASPPWRSPDRTRRSGPADWHRHQGRRQIGCLRGPRIPPRPRLAAGNDVRLRAD